MVDPKSIETGPDQTQIADELLGLGNRAITAARLQIRTVNTGREIKKGATLAQTNALLANAEFRSFQNRR